MIMIHRNEHHMIHHDDVSMHHHQHEHIYLSIRNSPTQEDSAVLSDDHCALEDLSGKDGHDRAIE